MRIAPLTDHPDLVPTIARWHWDEWGNTAAEGSLASRIENLRTRTHADRVPVMFVALDGEAPLGTTGLTECDMLTHPELSPWLASVYVTPLARGRGIARALVRRAMEQARAFGYTRLFLYTYTARGLYEQLGWYAIGEEAYEGHQVTLMQCDLPADVA